MISGGSGKKPPDEHRGQQENQHHGQSGIEFLAGLVNDRLCLVDVDSLFQADRRDLVDKGEVQRERQADNQHQPDQAL